MVYEVSGFIVLVGSYDLAHMQNTESANSFLNLSPDYAFRMGPDEGK